MEQSKQFYTYLHCKPNGEPFYVGKGSGRRGLDFSKRSQYHKNVVAKYGKELIEVYVFECDSEEQAFKDEIQQIAQFKKEGFKLVNLSTGGEGPSGYHLTIEHKNIIAKSNQDRIWTEESRAKLSTKNIGNTYNLGKVRTMGARQKLSESGKRRTQSEESKRKISAANSGNTYCKGRVYSDETIQKMSAAKKGVSQRKVACPYCPKIGGVSGMTKFHFNNCKYKK